MHAWQILQVRDGENLKQAGRKMWNERRRAREGRVLQRFIQRRRLEENQECGMNQQSRKGRSQSLLNDYYKPGTSLSASHTKSHLTLPTTPRNRHQKLHVRRGRDFKRCLTCQSSYREQTEEEHKFKPGSLCFKTHAINYTTSQKGKRCQMPSQNQAGGRWRESHQVL